MDKDLTREQCLKNLEAYGYRITESKSKEDADVWLGFIYLNRIAFAMLTESMDRLPIAEPEKMVGNDAMEFDGTWWRCDDAGGLQAFDEMDCVWYDIEIIDDDPDVVIYFMDIRAELMRK